MRLSEKVNNIIAIIRSKFLKSLFGRCGHNVFFGKIGELHAPENIIIGDNTCFGDYLYMNTWPDKKGTCHSIPKIVIGNNCNFGAMNHITCSNKITIGHNVLTGKWVTITDNSHGQTSKEQLELAPIERPLFSKGEVIIMDNVWIGDGARIMPGVTIGRGAVIGTNSVVTKDIPPLSVACGTPAKIIK